MKKLLLILLFVLSGCTSIPPISTWNWQLGNHKEAPGVIAITLKADNINTIRHFCTGIVVKPNVVLTAGHCLDNFPADQMWITSGCDIITEYACKHIRGKRTAFHPWYGHTEGIWNDLGVIITSENIDITPATIGSIKDVRRAEDLSMELKTAGFGKRLNGDNGMLYMGTIRVKQEHVYEFYTTHNDISGTCKGDSGGPAYFQDLDGTIKVVGILSRSKRSTLCGGEAIYTIPTMYVGWINEMLELEN